MWRSFSMSLSMWHRLLHLESKGIFRLINIFATFLLNDTDQHVHRSWKYNLWNVFSRWVKNALTLVLCTLILGDFLRLTQGDLWWSATWCWNRFERSFYLKWIKALKALIKKLLTSVETIIYIIGLVHYLSLNTDRAALPDLCWHRSLGM